MIKRILFFCLLSIGLLSAQNLSFESVTVSDDDTLCTIDLGTDVNLIQSDYGSTGEELRAIALEMHGTWTNDSLQVYAAIDPDSTYYPVYTQDGSLLYIIGTTGNSYITLTPIDFAGIRYIMLIGPAAEAAERLLIVVRRRY